MSGVRKFFEQVAADLVAQFIWVFGTMTAAIWEWSQGRSPLEIILLILMVFAAWIIVLRLFPDFFSRWRVTEKLAQGGSKQHWAFAGVVLVLTATWFFSQPTMIAETAGEPIVDEQIGEYAYLHSDTSTAVYPDGRAELFLQTSEGAQFTIVRYYVSPFAVQGDRKNPRYGEIGIGGKLRDVLSGGQFLPGKTLPAGHYFVEIDTNKRHFNQSLRLEWVKKELIETLEVTERGTGKKLRSNKGSRFGF